MTSVIATEASKQLQFEPLDRPITVPKGNSLSSGGVQARRSKWKLIETGRADRPAEQSGAEEPCRKSFHFRRNVPGDGHLTQVQGPESYFGVPKSKSRELEKMGHE